MLNFLLVIIWQVGYMPCPSYWIAMALVSLLDLEQWYGIKDKSRLFKTFAKTMCFKKKKQRNQSAFFLVSLLEESLITFCS